MNLTKEESEISMEDLKGRRYWKSLDDLAEAPAFKTWLEREFPQGASELSQGFDRRNFIKIMAASFGLAGLGLSGCRRPEAHILPYGKQPEEIIPGIPSYFSTSLPKGKENIPLIVETHESRPTKIEGNPSYKSLQGGTDVFSQASVLDLYDPDRGRKSRKNDKTISKGEVTGLLAITASKVAQSKGKGVAILAEESTSPTRKRLVKTLLKKNPQITWVEYDAIDNDNAAKASQQLFGKNLRTIYKLDKAKRVLALDSDFLHTESGNLLNTNAFSKARKVLGKSDSKKMNRLYSVESNLTLTGSMADHRLRLATSDQVAFTQLIAAAVFKQLDIGHDIVSHLEKSGAHLSVNSQWVEECAKDLISNKGSSVVIPGDHLPEEVHVLAHLINDALDAKGHTLNYLEAPTRDGASIETLASSISKGEINTLIILGGNPVYNTPADLKWESLQSSVSEVIRIGSHDDETAEKATYYIPSSHYLESWSDGLTFDGYYVPVQPMIEPLFESFNEIQVLAFLAGETFDPYTQVRKTFDSQINGINKDEQFNKFLREGILETPLLKSSNGTIDKTVAAKLVKNGKTTALSFSEANLEVRLTPSNHTWDGRYANNGWMQEAPEPITKLTWDNAILVSPKLANDLKESQGISLTPVPSQMESDGELVSQQASFDRGREMAPVGTLKVGDSEISGPVHIQPGLASYTVVVALGHGRTKAGRVGDNAGCNAYPLTSSKKTLLRTGGSLTLTDKSYKLANTQEHWSMEGRAIIREATVDDFNSNPDFVGKMGMESHSPPVYGTDTDMPLGEKAQTTPLGMSMYEFPDHTGTHQWGMSIDLNTCIGCNACVVSCQSENNIPVIGKFEVARGREMHWIRMDRYYSSTSDKSEGIPEDVQVSFQGMACAQCETAPCEQVCPVNATVHDSEGLNVMAYNRCVGTRYCANNCPYKVRRFNFFDWNKRAIGDYNAGPLADDQTFTLPAMQKNPDVSVRMRGVMEKCTYCVQRISEGKIQQKVKAKDSNDVKVPDGTIKTACQQVCPANAIVFGDLTDPESEVSKLKNSELDYSVLGYLNTRPRTTYLAKLRNPNPHMPDTYEQPFTRKEYEDRFGHGAHGHDDHHGHDNHHGHDHDDHAHDKHNHDEDHSSHAH